MSRDEAMAEKLRAALSRRDVAIRDYYDVDHAVRRLRPVLRDPDFAEFDLDRAFATVLEVAAALGYRP